ncbi:dihydroorotate oxidase [Lacticaseibacillus baoqingensis]|uniref:dihydroorotate oxidase (fumarate) n=1 Tax=Lacticaseibacillus baoqingensis TaxID=2486013 RepID=A0ABW4E5S5_9LACO|nr:dihydroorotate oxidase [Lacticaseibacillus baoqingensis]
MTSLATQIGDFHFKNVLMNASGVHCMTAAELDELAASPAGTLVTKSGTPNARPGNPEPRYQALTMGSINSMGLPNKGLDYYLDYALAFQVKHPQQPIFMSVAGMGPDDYVTLAQKIQDSDFTGLTEFNLSCPNVPGKPQIAYDLETTEQILDNIFRLFKKPAGVKLPPFFDLAQFDQMAALLNRYPLQFINSINSLGNGLMIDPATDTTVIRPKGGFGGIGGAYAKPIALANVRAFRQRLRAEIAIIGTGGVNTGRDVYDLILCGADMVQLGTVLQEEGIPAFARLSQELEAIMATKGYTQLADFKGQLHTIA